MPRELRTLSQNCKQTLPKILVSVKCLSAILGPEMAAPILWTPGKKRPFCRKNHVNIILVFRGGGILGFFFGGGKADFIFMGARIFLIVYVKTIFSEQLSERLSELVGRQNFSPNSRSVFFSKLGWFPRARNSPKMANRSLDMRFWSTAELFRRQIRACFHGESHKISCTLYVAKTHRCASVKLRAKGGYRFILGEYLSSWQGIRRYVGLSCKQKIGLNKFWNRRGMPTSLGVKFGRECFFWGGGL